MPRPSLVSSAASTLPGSADGIAAAFKPRMGPMLRRAYLTGGQAAEVGGKPCALPSWCKCRGSCWSMSRRSPAPLCQSNGSRL